jgi:eukaryotic-like serine/threonine-protein kinase
MRHTGLDAEQFLDLSRLLDRALELPADQRGPWLEQLTEVSAPVRQKLGELLSRAERLERDDFLGTLPDLNLQIQEGSEGRIGPVAGDVIGAYRLIRELGQGGMASVWLADRVDGRLQRQIALKLPHTSPRSRLAERLDRERDILAGLTHPNIARLYDAGLSASGQPFLAMEYVEGIPFLAHCDAARLGIEGRLDLFIQVLEAVRYAHSRLVIHRDLKPSNILVTAQNQVALLDFGIAKLLVDGETLETELTQQGGRSLTPSYASPEQILGLPLSTGTDIYSLGVVLYELLTGVLPYRLKRNSRGALEDAIVESALTRPSQGTLAGQAQLCGITPARLAKTLRGDLDAIVSRALRKAPTERYADAHEFADDLRRCLEHQPVRAREGARTYLLQRFARRHWRSLSAALALFVILIAGITAVAWQARIAGIEAHKALAVENFLLDIFKQNSTDNPDGEIARHTTAEQLLDISSKKIVTGLDDQPEVRAAMLATLSDLYEQLELFDKAETLARERLKALQRAGGNPSLELANAQVQVGRNLTMEGHYPEASVLLKQGISTLGQIRKPDPATLARALLELGRIGYHSKPTDDPETLQQLTRAAELFQICCANSESQLDALQMLARLSEYRNDLAAAERQYRQFLELASHPAILARAPMEAGHAHEDLGSFLLVTHRFEEAQAHLRDAVEIYGRASGPNSMDSAGAKSSLGQTLISLNRPAEGQALLAEALGITEKTQGIDNIPTVSLTRYYLAAAEFDRGEIVEAARHLAKNIQVFEAAGAQDPNKCAGQCALSFYQTALVLMTEGDLANARRRLARMLEAAHALHFTTGETYGMSLVTGARLDALTGHSVQAAEELKRVSEMWPATKDRLPRPYVLATLALIEISAVKDANAEPKAQALLDRILALPEHQYFADWEARAQRTLGTVLIDGGRAPEAEPHLRRAAQLRAQIDVEDSPWLAEARISLADALITENRLSEADGLLRQAADAQANQPVLGEQFRAPLRAAQMRLAHAKAVPAT